jgi:hypothetical protein
MSNCEKAGVFFARGTDLIDARLMDPSEIPAPGSTIELKERSLHVRSTERCTRPCCKVEPTRLFKVLSSRTFASDERKAQELIQQGRGSEVPPSALMQVVDDRQWDEAACSNHEWCNLFDSYTLSGYLGVDPMEEPHSAVIVEVE